MDATLTEARQSFLQHCIFDLSTLDSVAAHQRLRQHGCIVITNAVTTTSLQDMKPLLGQAISNQWKYNGLSADDITALQKGELHHFNKYRNSKGACGNAGFGFLFKSFLPDDQYPTALVGEHSVKFDFNMFHKVLLDLLCHPDNRKLGKALLDITHKDGMVAWDSVKIATNPRTFRGCKVKGLVEQALTPPHIDIYSGERFQAIVNNDAVTKLCFVPGSNTLCLSSGKGYQALGQKDIYLKYGLAPPARSIVIWTSGVVHFEAETVQQGSMFQSVSYTNHTNQQRERYVVSVHKPKLSQPQLTFLARTAERGMCPAFYFKVNSDTPVGDEIMNRKTTLYRIPRQLDEEEGRDMKQLLDKSALDSLPSDTLRRRLYGLQ